MLLNDVGGATPSTELSGLHPNKVKQGGFDKFTTTEVLNMKPLPSGS